MSVSKVTIISLLLGGAYALAPNAMAYPEFQEFAEKRSQRTVNCAMCHTNGNGPTGTEHGQVGSLNAEELNRLSQARAALEPGLKVDSPILNKFGNHIIEAIGKKKVLAARKNPQHLAVFLGSDSDQDGDGIPDSKEYLDGTDPLNNYHGDPAALFSVNLNRYAPHVALAALAIFLLDFGFARVLKGFELKSRRKDNDEAGPPSHHV